MPAARTAGLVTEPGQAIEPGQVIEPEQVIEIDGTPGGRFTASYTEWNGQPSACADHDHLTRQDALTCAEDRLRYRA